MRGPGCTRTASALALIVHILASVAAILIAALAIRLVLIEAAALAGLTIAIAGVLLIAILIASRGALFTMLIVVSFLVGHDVPPRVKETQAMCPVSFHRRAGRNLRCAKVAVLQLHAEEVPYAGQSWCNPTMAFRGVAKRGA